MKKVMVGILIFIPILILVMIALISVILTTQAFIGVESVDISLKNSSDADYLTLSFSDSVQQFSNYFDVVVKPDKATDKALTWSIKDITVLDEEYKNRYEAYLDSKDDPSFDGEVVKPAVTLVDDFGHDMTSNSSSKFKIYAYCAFYVEVKAETKSARALVYVGGFDLESVQIKGNKNIEVGDNTKLEAVLNPVDSKILSTKWISSDNSVLAVDQNGIVTALKSGTADVSVEITCNNTTGDGTRIVSSKAFTLTVAKSVSAFGKKVFTHNSDVLLADLSLVASDIASVTGGSVVGDKIVLSSDKAEVTLSNAKTLSIERCTLDQIAIMNANLLDKNSDFVLATDNSSLVLSVEFLSDFAQSKINQSEVVWSSSDSSVASVKNGVVKGLKSGRADITATYGGVHTIIEINVREKVVSLMLGTSDSSQQKGLAKETIYASHRLTDIDGAKIWTESNGVDILIDIPSPPSTDDIDEINAFYSVFDFKFVEDGRVKDESKFAYIDPNQANRIMFKDNIKGETEIVVQVSAKYPMYASTPSFTTRRVTLKVVDGVEIAPKLVVGENEKTPFEQFEALGKFNQAIYDRNEKRIQDANKANQTNPNVQGLEEYTNVVLTSDIEYPRRQIVYWFSDIYGNDHEIWAELGLFAANELMQVKESNVKISNLTMTGNKIEDDYEIKPGEDNLLKNSLIYIPSVDWRNGRIENFEIEYSIMQNAHSFGTINNVDITISNSIFRNYAHTMINVPCRINEVNSAEKRFYLNEDNVYKTADGVWKSYPQYSDITTYNVAMSNMLGGAFSFYYDHVSHEVINNQWQDRDKAELDWFMERDLHTQFHQKGFLDIFNWRDTNNLDFIDLGSGMDEFEVIVKNAIGSLIEDNRDINKKFVKYVRDGQMVSTDEFLKIFDWETTTKEERQQKEDMLFEIDTWLHFGFQANGLVNLNFVEPILLDPEFEDERFVKLDVWDLLKDDSIVDSVPFLEDWLSIGSCALFGYSNSVETGPLDTLDINRFVAQIA